MSRRRFSAKALVARLLEFDGRCAICRGVTGGAAGLECIVLADDAHDLINPGDEICVLDDASFKGRHATFTVLSRAQTSKACEGHDAWVRKEGPE